jgi:hypothetical protein
MMIFILAVFGGSDGFPGIMLIPFITVPVFMIIIGIFIVVSGFYNAFAKNRISSADIMTYEEEPDPGRHLVLNDFDKKSDPGELRPPPASSRRRSDTSGEKGGFCPYCGAGVKADYEFCRKCGSDI